MSKPLASLPNKDDPSDATLLSDLEVRGGASWYRLVQVRGLRKTTDLFVRYTITVDSKPQVAAGYWPINPLRSRNPYALIDKQLAANGTEIFHIHPDEPASFAQREAMIALLDGGRTEAVCLRYFDAPKPRSRLPLRWHRGRWEKETKKGWTPA